MIGYLVGDLTYKSAPTIVVEAAGVGYEVSASLSTFAALPALGERVKLLTHFVVREDAQLLFGFADEAERRLFRTLIKVSGVGPKLALAILSGMDVSGFNRCILASDIKTLTSLPGVGKKTAERLIIEMKDRISEWQHEPAGVAVSPMTSNGHAAMLAEAETALIALGYKPAEASKVMVGIDIDNYDSTESLVRAALQSTLVKA